MFRAIDSLNFEHDWRLIALAGVVCFLGSLTAISLFHRACALKDRARLVWLLIAGVATGCGVWATHFVAMLAMQLGFQVNYDLVLTVLSLIVAIAASTLGLACAVYATPSWRAPFGGAVVGLGIAAMHFIGMAGLELPGTIVWSPVLVVASVALGTMFGALALTTAARGDGLSDFLGGAVLLAAAILSLHFTAMAAADNRPRHHLPPARRDVAVAGLDGRRDRRGRRLDAGDLPRRLALRPQHAPQGQDAEHRDSTAPSTT